MHLSTRLDFDLVAVEQADELTLLIELTAPTATAAATRQPATLQVVLDRSGSMSGDRLEGAKAALLSLVDRLDPSDNLGLVAFDDAVEIVIPAGPLNDKAHAKHAIAAILPGGATDLSSGYLRGLQEARRVAGPAGATLLLVSDGHANAGVRDAGQLGKVAAEAQTHRVTTSTLGFGLGYDEELLSALGRGGAGNELFAEEADTAVALIAGEIDGLLDQVAQAASLRVTWTSCVTGIEALNDLPVVALPDGAMLELGSFYAGETRRLLVKLHVPAIAALGLMQVATMEFTHVALPDLVQHTTTVPILVNVVPGDQAAGRIPDPQVRTEALFQQTQKAKRESSRLLSQGRLEEASSLMAGTSFFLRAQSQALPAPMAAELEQEAVLLDALAEESRYDLSRAAKASSYDATLKSRNRGRQSRGGRFVLHWAVDGAHDRGPRDHSAHHDSAHHDSAHHDSAHHDSAHHDSAHHDSADSTLVLEEWELQRLVRQLSRDLALALTSTVGKVHGQITADAIAVTLGEGHPAHPFFSAASSHGGFVVERT